MNVTAHTFRTALARAMDGHAMNRQQARALFNPDPEVNSLAEHIASLAHFGVPQTRIHQLLLAVREVLRLNEAEDGCHTSLAGQLDALTTQLRHAELNDPAHQALGVKAIARALRPALAQLNTVDGVAYFQAASTIRDVIETTTPEQLLAPSLRHELGAGPHDRLLHLINSLQETRA